MRKAQKLATGIAAAMLVSAISAPVSFAADNAFGIDEINWTSQDWNSIAMTNDDTVETGAVIRTEADPDSKAAGYLYRGAAARIVDKGDEWTKVESGRVTGYVRNEYLAFGDQAKGLAAHYGTQGIVANWDDVNVFSKNDADSQIMAQIQDGTPMSMLEDNGHWIAVQHGADSAGFVSEEDVTRVLLVDSAVPAEGEDEADVPATMTAASIPASMYAESTSDGSVSGGSEEEADSYTLSAASYEEEAVYESDDSAAYAESANQEWTEDSSASAEQEWTGDSTAYADTWTEDAAYSSGDASYSQDTTDYSDASAVSSEFTTQTVSDNYEIQALYDPYISAQNAAMDCTSEEDARAKAEAATNAWNAYLAACADPSAAGSASEASGSDSQAPYAEYTGTQPEAADTQEAAQAEASYGEYTEAQTAQTDAPAQESTASSGGNAYGSYSDLDLLAAIIWCEAGNQSYDGMVAVGQVVMNRVASPSYPNTISEVLNQPGQFTPASSGTLQSALASGVNSTCYQAAQDAMNGAAPVPGYPMYFNTHSGSYQLGAHYFS
jgi:spore germination cell wall hydrolase CwlJ-like protein/SH3-like domain-containing protein